MVPCLVAGDSGRVFAALAHEVTQAAPGGRMAHIHAQRLRIATLRLSLPAGPLSSPQVSQVGMHIHLRTSWHL